MMFDKEFQKRLTEFEVFDEIKMKVIPRYKQSELSGDEWRQHVEVTFYFKGEYVKSFGCRNMEKASMLLGHHLINLSGDMDESIPDKVRELEEKKCCQPSCCNDATHKLYLKELFSASGEKLDSEEKSFKYYRKFCKHHLTRGDCSREDSNSNYTEVSVI